VGTALALRVEAAPPVPPPDRPLIAADCDDADDFWIQFFRDLDAIYQRVTGCEASA